MRAVLGAGGLAALSAIAAAIVVPPHFETVAVAPPQQPTQDQTNSTTNGPAPTPGTTYILLQPGQTVPPGAMFITGSAPPQVTVVAPVTTPAPVRVVAPPKPAPTPIIIKTTQSGKVVP